MRVLSSDLNGGQVNRQPQNAIEEEAFAAAQEPNVNRSRLLLRLELRSNPEMLCVVRGAMAKLAETVGFSNADSRAVVLAVDEALTNIIRHAYGGEGERPIFAELRHVEVERDGQPKQALEITLEDEGSEVDHEKLCGRPLEEVRPGGLGLHFIRESMDTVEFRRIQGRNQLRLVKFVDGAKLEKGLREK
jgi:anti-sigma regulatory factor (Ser/Thr protein kinase)